MRLLSRIDVPGRPGKAVELLQGDLTVPDAAHAFDLLVVSAFPDDYVPTAGSLIGALHRQGLSVASLAAAKDLDLRAHFSCWLSRDTAAAGLGFQRLLCFEPRVRGAPPEVIGDIFRALMPILGDHSELRRVAMPIVAAGDQSWPVARIVKPLLDAALQWLKIGLPLDVLRIVAYSDAQAEQAAACFAVHDEIEKTMLLRPGASSAPRPPDEFDVFLSYAHEDASLIDRFCALLAQRSPQTRVFLDRQSIAIGSAWQPAIFESLDHCRKVVAMLSPAYLGSKVCKEEFNIAWARSRDTEQDILFPVYLFSAKLPTYMSYRNYFDAREGHAERIEQACDSLLQALA